MSIAIFHGDKGGCGKSTVAATYLEYVASKGHPVSVVECDPRNPDLGEYCNGAFPIEHINLRSDNGWIALGDFFASSDTDDIVISLPAGIGFEFQESSARLLKSLTRTNRRAVIFWTLNRQLNSIALLKDLREQLNDAMPIIAVRNLFFGDAGRFGRWENSNTRKALLASNGAEMSFPDLYDELYDATFGAEDPKRFSSFADFTLGKQLFLEEYLEKAFKGFDSVEKLVGTGVR